MKRITAIFDTVAAAQAARDVLVRQGLDGGDIALTASETSDGVAGEAPGQSYENQPGQPERDSRANPYHTAIRSGTCALVFDAANARQVKRVRDVLAAQGARRIVSPPG